MSTKLFGGKLFWVRYLYFLFVHHTLPIFVLNIRLSFVISIQWGVVYACKFQIPTALFLSLLSNHRVNLNFNLSWFSRFPKFWRTNR